MIFSGNRTHEGAGALSCHETFEDGGGNVQWPGTRSGGRADTACAATVLFADPRLEPLADNGGPTRTMALPAGSPALGIGERCPDRDQRGMPRSVPCDAGAYERQR